jgi:hypothetical protein
MDDLEQIDAACDQIEPYAAAIVRRLIAIIRQQGERIAKLEEHADDEYAHRR